MGLLANASIRLHKANRSLQMRTKRPLRPTILALSLAAIVSHEEHQRGAHLFKRRGPD